MIDPNYTIREIILHADVLSNVFTLAPKQFFPSTDAFPNYQTFMPITRDLYTLTRQGFVMRKPWAEV
jgi:hypothetical protein